MNVNRVKNILENVTDPEIPVLTIEDLGIIRDVKVDENERVTVVITPTYSGCPAMDTIEDDIRSALVEAGYEVDVKTILDPPWTTEWMSENGKRKLEEYGIAPPNAESSDKRVLFGKAPEVRCPHCKSKNTSQISQFGSTPCKSLYKCSDCMEPFDYFKCI